LSLKELYSHAGLFVLPSYPVGLPIVLLEAVSPPNPAAASIPLTAFLTRGTLSEHIIQSQVKIIFTSTLWNGIFAFVKRRNYK